MGMDNTKLWINLKYQLENVDSDDKEFLKKVLLEAFSKATAYRCWDLYKEYELLNIFARKYSVNFQKGINSNLMKIINEWNKLKEERLKLIHKIFNYYHIDTYLSSYILKYDSFELDLMNKYKKKYLPNYVEKINSL
tara:strand:- start:564 stop:974 length:411 start_codon:yes stop_codon:yes gene_type:complete